MLTASVFVLVLVFCTEACVGLSVSGHQRFPQFMRHLYHSFLAGGSAFSNIVHSNAAFGKYSQANTH